MKGIFDDSTQFHKKVTANDIGYMGVFLHPLIFAFFFSIGGVCANFLVIFLKSCEILTGLREFTLCTGQQ
jgi:hypothetical protein